MIPVFIPYVNREDLLRRAVASIPSTFKTVVINNSGLPLCINCKVWTPDVPLTAAQSLNLMQTLAKRDKVPFYFFMHNDAEAVDDTAERLYAMALEKHSGEEKWGVIFTHYDALAAFNTAAFDKVGPWDRFLEQYCTDNDMYRRLRLEGYSMIDSGLLVNHVGSQTIHSDSLYRLQVDLMYPCRQAYYKAKWGGDPGQETFSAPWNGRFDGTT